MHDLARGGDEPRPRGATPRSALVETLDASSRRSPPTWRRRRKSVQSAGERARARSAPRCSGGSWTSTSAGRCSRRRGAALRAIVRRAGRAIQVPASRSRVRDRALVDACRAAARLRSQRARPTRSTLQDALEENRQDKRREEERLARRSSASARRASRRRGSRRTQTEDRLERMRATEAQLTNAIASLEADRRRAEGARPAATRAQQLDQDERLRAARLAGRRRACSTRSARPQTSEQHDDPLERRRASRRAIGTPVPVGRAGHGRERADQLGTYGLTVIIDHGGGDYSIYGSLARADVRPRRS